MSYVPHCILITKIAFFSFRFPCCKKTYIDNIIAHPTTPPEELKLHIHLSQYNSIKSFFLRIFIYTSYFFKNAIIVAFVFMMYNHYSPEENLKQLGGDLYEFTCIRTNCTSFIDESISLATEITKLPLFAICHPILSSGFTPILYLDSVGLLAFTLSAFGVFLIGTIIPVQQILFPSVIEGIMFILAPITITRLTRESILQILEEIRNSYKNYVPVHFDWTTKNEQGPEFNTEFDCIFAGKHLMIKHYKKPTVDYEGRADNFLNDCMPSVRTIWWREICAKMMILYNCTICGIIAFAAYSLLLYIQLYIIDKYESMDKYMSSMRQKGCSIWHADKLAQEYDSSELSSIENNHNDTSRLIHVDLNQVARRVLRWNIYSLPETSIINLWPLFSLFLVSSYYFITIIELNCWLAELQYQLLTALDMSKFELHRAHRRTDKITNLDKLRNNFINKTDLLFVALFRDHKLTAMDGSTINERKKFLLEWMGDEYLDTDWLVEFYEKLYVNMRLFTRNIRHLRPIMAFLIMATHLINYSLVLIALWYCRNMKNFIREPMLVGIVAWSFSNAFILFAAKFHANAKRIQPLVWQLIAEMTKLRGVQAEHLRVLWIKQAQILDYEGGISLNALGIRITYVNIIQFMIWTATVLLMAAKN